MAGTLIMYAWMLVCLKPLLHCDCTSQRLAPWFKVDVSCKANISFLFQNSYWACKSVCASVWSEMLWLKAPCHTYLKLNEQFSLIHKCSRSMHTMMWLSFSNCHWISQQNHSTNGNHQILSMHGLGHSRALCCVFWCLCVCMRKLLTVAVHHLMEEISCTWFGF